jgi:conjugative relaxase-like TrwC/TraI family protein
MLTIGKLGHGQADYYLQAVAQGIEDYYSGAGEAPGRWLGSAADGLDAHGQVDGDALYRALAGLDPVTGAELRAGEVKVPGWDLTFSAPKSVSILFGLGDPDVARQARDAHEAAVDAALGYMERHAAVARRGHGGLQLVPGNGFVGAAFRHRSSRAGDPQLHTHVLVANMTRGPDGRWTALDGRRLYAHARTGGYLYQAKLRAELTRRLGVEWTPVRRGQAEVVGIAAAVIRAFSRRRQEVEQEMAARGEHSARAAQVAALNSRRAKDYSVAPEAMREEWWERAERLGLDGEQLRAVRDQAQPIEVDEALVDRVVEELASPEGLTARRSTFVRRDVIQAWCEQLARGGEIELIEDLADDFLASDDAIVLAADVAALSDSDVIRRTDGQVVPSVKEERPHSTPELLAIERDVIHHVLTTQDAERGVVAAHHVAATLSRRPTLSDEQETMVRRLLLDGAAVQVVVGPAGTGKTFAMDAAREAWEAHGYSVVGAALARRAAHELHDGAGIDSTSVHALLLDLREVGAPNLLGRGRSVLVVDEAGMVGTRQLAELLDHADQAQAKVVLLGDPAQLPEIDAGGTLRGLVARTDPIHLHENRRQVEQWERDALALLRVGDVADALARYEDRGRIVVEDTAVDVRARMVRDWWRARESGEEAMMIAMRRSDVADLNGRARALMRAAGRLGETTILVGDREIAVGDHIVTLRNAPGIGVLNGTRGVVTSVDPGRREIGLQTTTGVAVRLHSRYLDASDERGRALVDHAYAITGHKSQGMTADRTHVLGTDDLYREWGYVALSRGRRGNHLYLVAPAPGPRAEIAPNAEPPRDPYEEAARNLLGSRAQRLALDQTTAELVAQPTSAIEATERELARALDRLTTRTRLETQLAQIAQQRAALTPDPAAEKPPDARVRAVAHQAQQRDDALRRREVELRERLQSIPQPEPADQLAARYLAVRAEVDRRRAVRLVAERAEPASYLRGALGARPDSIAQRRAWDRAAASIERYRTEFGVTDTAGALGPRPDDLRQRARWNELQTMIQRRDRDVQRRRAVQRDGIER